MKGREMRTIIQNNGWILRRKPYILVLLLLVLFVAPIVSCSAPNYSKQRTEIDNIIVTSEMAHTKEPYTEFPTLIPSEQGAKSTGSFSTPSSFGGYLQGNAGKLVFLSTRNGGSKVFIYSFVDGKIEDLLRGIEVQNSNINCRSPSWSPNGEEIIFASDLYEDSEQFNLFIINQDGTNLRQITSSTQDEYSPDWSPNGKDIAYVTVLDDQFMISILDLGSSATRYIAKVKGVDIPRVSWSPDGKFLAFHCSPSIYEDTPTGFSKLCISKIADGSVVALEGDYEAEISRISWSPDGTEIAFTNRTDDGLRDIFSINIETFQLTRLTRDPGVERSPSWSPDGKLIAVTADRVNRDLYIISPVEDIFYRLTFDRGDDYDSDWSQSN
jgi:Tol biopolymer transport system component